MVFGPLGPKVWHVGGIFGKSMKMSFRRVTSLVPAVTLQFLSIAAIFVYFFFLQKALPLQHVEEVMLFSSFLPLYVALLNAGGEHRFVDDVKAASASLRHVLSSRRMIFYTVISIFGGAIPFITFSEWLQLGGVSLFILVCLFIFFQAIYTHLGFLLVARDKNTYQLLINFIGAVIMPLPLFIPEWNDIYHVIFAMTVSGFVKVFLAVFVLINTEKLSAVGDDFRDKLFIKKYFVASLGTPLGFAVNFFTGVAIAMHYENHTSVAMLLAYRIFYQVIAFSTSTLSPIFFQLMFRDRYVLDFSKALKFTATLSCCAVAVALVAVNLPPIQWLLGRLFLTVPISEAVYIVCWLIPAGLCGLLAGLFYHSFVALGGAATRNLILGMRLTMIGLICLLGMTEIRVPAFEFLVLIDTLLVGADAMILLRRAASKSSA